MSKSFGHDHSHKSSWYIGTRNVVHGTWILISRFVRGYTSSGRLDRRVERDPD